MDGMSWPLIGKGRPNLASLPKIKYNTPIRQVHLQRKNRGSHHQLVKWVLRYNTEGKGR